MTFTFPLVAGLITSILHVITGPDHLAAVTPFVVEAKKKAWKIGLFWSFGHLAGMLAIGILFVLFKSLIPIETISKYSEQLVGLVLIGIGIWAFYKIFKKNNAHKHLHVHSEHAPLIHKHEHTHVVLEAHNHTHKNITQQTHFTSFSIGFLHGLAGIAHFLLFLPILGFNNQWDAFTYIIGFGTGIILAMTSYAFVIGTLASWSKNGHNDLFFNGIRMAGGLFAIIIGIYWLYGT
jgi:ABC-type nickel/cobalt efflux system permease component RcnA